MELRRFFPFDEVQYCGEKLRGELKGKLGTICANVIGSKKSYVVRFDDDAYVLDESLLERYLPSFKDKQAKLEAEVLKRWSKKNDE